MAGRIPGVERGKPPGITALLELIDEHRGAFEYDWRTRFGTPLSDIGWRMTWGEALRLTRRLASDPSSSVAAAIEGWPHPWSREAFILADVFDLLHQVNAKRKPKPYPRPSNARTTRRTAPAKHLTAAEIEAALRMAGHTAPIPTR